MATAAAAPLGFGPELFKEPEPAVGPPPKRFRDPAADFKMTNDPTLVGNIGDLSTVSGAGLHCLGTITRAVRENSTPTHSLLAADDKFFSHMTVLEGTKVPNMRDYTDLCPKTAPRLT